MRNEILRALDGANPLLGQMVPRFIAAVIVLSVFAISIETVPSLSAHWSMGLAVFEWICLVVFLAEFVARLACTPNPLSYLFSFWGVIDALACIPALLLFRTDLVAIRALRLIRLARILKLTKTSAAFDRLGRAFWFVRYEMSAFMMVAGLLIYFAAVGIYFFENSAQPATFSSIPASLWWAIATLTTVGYGDVYPITAGGRIFTGLILLVGLGIVAVPSALVTSALTERTTNNCEPTTENSQ
ncbi:ion transporter [Actibacterium sp.]|uniref:ion transporter n=1 Tax=Actibacterium sp. TaxID=1872125 RepID=UPI003564E519